MVHKTGTPNSAPITAWLQDQKELKISRIDVIGQNGNTGEHYMQGQTEEHFLNKLVEDHWQYVKEVLEACNSKTSYEINEIGFHYKSAMIHGWKHAKEYHNVS